MSHFKTFIEKVSHTTIEDLIENWESVVGNISDKNDFINTAKMLSHSEMMKANYSLLIHGLTCSNYKFFLLRNIENYIFNGYSFIPKTYRNEFETDGINLGKPIYYDFCRNHNFLNPPSKTGLYYLFNKGILVYIGFSRNISNRLKSHNRDRYKPFDAVLWITKKKFSLDDWLKFERDQIRFWSPCLNKNLVE